ncbi:hypothetical protein EV137_5350 [Kribbella pratensis]|uniref:Uncharacterized protein n=1 Tax=Kribbella pratensis TaxID=2512112 RepID=A0ABY2F9L6_9ACTN|nr:hypothetical protein [Kribbella pratensis]TDW87277.1 hypothetical protein EV137_5350 [Kribbella pratensis]
MATQWPVAIVEVDDLPEPADGALEVRCLRPDVAAYVNGPYPDPVVTLYVRTGIPYERLIEWVEMRLSTIGQGPGADDWNFHEEGDYLVADKLCGWVEMPEF